MIEVASCPGCGGSFEPKNGPVHAYMTSSPACWAAFGRLLAAEYENATLMRVHRLSVDAYALQHPGDRGDRRARQSVGLHLARLYRSLELGLKGADANRPMLEFTSRKEDLPTLAPPAVFTMTMADIDHAVGGADHTATVERWARTTPDDWRHAHDAIRAFIAG